MFESTEARAALHTKQLNTASTEQASVGQRTSDQQGMHSTIMHCNLKQAIYT